MEETGRPEHFVKIHELMRAGRLEDVLKLIYSAEERALRQPYSADPNHSWYIVGDAFFRLERYSEARDAFRRSLEDWPEDVDAYLALGNALSAAGDPGGARDALLQANTLAPGDPRISYNLGNAYYDLGDLDKAAFFYGSASELQDAEVRKLSKANLRTLESARSQKRE